MTSLAEGMRRGASLYLDFKEAERRDRYNEALIAESKHRMQRQIEQDSQAATQEKFYAAQAELTRLESREASLRASGKYSENEISSMLSADYARLANTSKGYDDDFRKGDRTMLDTKVGADGRIAALVHNADSGTTSLMTQDGKPLGEGGLPVFYKDLGDLKHRVKSQLSHVAQREGFQFQAPEDASLADTAARAQRRQAFEQFKTVVGAEQRQRAIPGTGTEKQTEEQKPVTQEAPPSVVEAADPMTNEGEAPAPEAAVAPAVGSAEHILSQPDAYDYTGAVRVGGRGLKRRSSTTAGDSEVAKLRSIKEQQAALPGERESRINSDEYK